MKNIIKQHPVIAILRNVPEQDFLYYLDSLYEGGLRAFEISFSHDGAERQIREAKMHLPCDVPVGAGTILTVSDAGRAQDAGADFMLSPSANPSVLSHCAKENLKFLPGVFSPTDVSICLEYGFSTLKLFPADCVNTGYLKALKGPFPDTDYVAVGGVSPENIFDYLNAGYIGAGIGSSLVKKEDFADKNWSKIRASINQFIDHLNKEMNK